MNIEHEAFLQLDLAKQLSENEFYSPSKAKESYYTQRLGEFRKKNPHWRRKRPPHRKLSHTKAIKCFEKCVKVQASKERNSFRRKARLLKAAKDLGLSTFIKREEISQLVLEQKSCQQGQSFQLLSAAERKEMERPIVRWLLPGLIPAQDLTIIGGRPKVGKTRVAVAIAAAVLNGTNLFDLPAPSTPKPVILCSDDQADGDTCEMLSALNLWDNPDLSWSRHFRLNETDLDNLLDAIKANPGALVIIDSLRSISRCLRHGENDPEIGATLYDLKEAVTDAGGTLLLVHHCNKANDLIGVEALSGHNAIAGAANGVLTLHYLEEKNGQPNKQATERRLVREARSGDGFDLVIDRDGAAGFRRVSDLGEWKQQQQEANNREKLSEIQQEVLAAVGDGADQWMTRRQLCEAVGVEWVDRGRTPEAQRVTRALHRLVEINLVEAQRVGVESTYRVYSSRENTKSVMTVMPLSHTNGFRGITQSDDSDDSDDKEAPVSSVSSVSSNEVMTPKPLQSQGGIDVITDSPPLQPQEKKRRRTQLAFAIPELSPEKQPDEDDPAWGPTAKAEAA